MTHRPRCRARNGRLAPQTREMFGALQRTDPRCGDKPVSAEDQALLAQLAEIVRQLTGKQ